MLMVAYFVSFDLLQRNIFIYVYILSNFLLIPGRIRIFSLERYDRTRYRTKRFFILIKINILSGTNKKHGI